MKNGRRILRAQVVFTDWLCCFPAEELPRIKIGPRAPKCFTRLMTHTFLQKLDTIIIRVQDLPTPAQLKNLFTVRSSVEGFLASLCKGKKNAEKPRHKHCVCGEAIGR
jgi:hypothetical protein